MKTDHLKKYLETNKRDRAHAGFTIIETLVGITILLLALVGTLSIAGGGIDLGRYTEDRLTAVYLAQEGMEFIRFTRDSFIIQGTDSYGWDQWRTGTAYADGSVPPVSDCIGNACIVDAVERDIQACSGGPDTCPNITYHADDNLYGYGTGSGWSDTNFKRSVEVEDAYGGNDYEVKVVVTVSWEHDGKVREEVVQEHLLGWYAAP